MGTITFEVHPITLTSPRIHACNHVSKHFWSFCFLFSLHIFLFEYIMHGHIRDRKETTQVEEDKYNVCQHGHKIGVQEEGSKHSP